MENSVSHTPAHNSTATVAPFRAWRGLQIVIAEGPTEFSITAHLGVNTPNERAWIMESFDLSFKGIVSKIHRICYTSTGSLTIILLISSSDVLHDRFMKLFMCCPKISVRILAGLLLSCLCLSANGEIYRYIDPQGRLIFTDKPKHAGYIQLEKTLSGWTVRPSYSWKRNQRKLSPTIERIAEKHQLSHHLVHAVIMVESAYNPRAVSKAGAQGLMQLMPATANRFGVNDPYNPSQNINGGTQYLRHLLDLFKNDLKLALAAYNAGENAVKKYNNRIPPYKETQRYVEKVLKHYKKYTALEKRT